MEISASGERLLLVDALRGFALLGILIVNAVVFASPYHGQSIPDPNFQGTADKVVRVAIAFLFETKFYLIFSFLFGYSFTLLMRSVEAAGKSFTLHMLRRLAGLWVIGVGHAVFLFYCDILTNYAVFGVILLALRNRRERRLLHLVVWLFAAMAIVLGGTGILYGLDTSIVDPATAQLEAEEALKAYRGTVSSVILQNLRELSWASLAVGLVLGPSVLAIFLLGLMADRRSVLAELERYRRLLYWLMLGGLVIGLPGAAFYAHTTVVLAGSGWEILGLSFGLLTAPFLSGAYVAAAALWFGTPSGKVLALWLAPAGRMALSNYLLQSLVCCVIFYAYGFRLIGEVGPPVVLALALTIFAVQLILSRWWIDRFAYGPVEWLLRAVTNLQVPVFRRSRLNPA